MDSRRRRPLRPGQWLQIALAGLLGIVVALGVASVKSPVYKSNMRFFMSAVGDANPSNTAQAGSFAQQLVKSYPSLVTSEQVTTAVISALHLTLTPAQLQSKISAQVPLDTVVLEVSVSDSNASTAKRIADGVAAVLPGFLEGIQKSKGATSGPIVVTTVQQPSLPTAATSPNTKLDAVLGLLLGLGGGVAWVLLHASHDESIRSTEEAETSIGAPVLIEIPYGPDALPSALHGEASSSPRSEAYRQLRTSVQSRAGDDDVGVVVVTSALRSEGRTTTAANLAVAMALAGRRVTLIDADLREPHLSEHFGYGGESGLTDVLLGKARLEDEVRLWRADMRFGILPAGEAVDNPSELLSSRAMREILAMCRRSADIVIVDSPPLLSVTDGAVLTTLSDGALLVVRHGKTSAENASRAAARITEVNGVIRGIVINHPPPRLLARGKAKVPDEPDARALLPHALRAEPKSE